MRMSWPLVHVKLKLGFARVTCPVSAGPFRVVIFSVIPSCQLEPICFLSKTAQPNNSDFGKSDEAYQQLAIAKLRAIETGRSLVNISTVGPSAVYLADGTEVASLKAFTQGFMNTDVPLRNSKTPALFTVVPLTFGSVTASILLFGSLVLRRVRGRARR